MFSFGRLYKVPESSEAVSGVCGGIGSHPMIPAGGSTGGFRIGSGVFGGGLLLAIICDLFCLFVCLDWRWFLEFKFAMPSLNDRISGSIALEMFANECPVTSAMPADDSRQLLILIFCPL